MELNHFKKNSQLPSYSVSWEDSPSSNQELYVLVGQGDGGESLFELASQLVKTGAQMRVLYLMDSESENDWSTWMRKVVPLGEFFLTKKGLEKRLKEILSNENQEVTTFIAGEELFLQGVVQVCMSLGLEREQICRKVVFS